MEVKLISEHSFDKGRTRSQDVKNEGSLEGNYLDLLLYVKWILECKDVRSQCAYSNERLLNDSLIVFSEKYKMPFVTKEFLMNQLPKEFPNKSMRVGYLLKLLGKTTKTTLRFFHLNNRQLVKEEYSRIIDKAVLKQEIKEMKERGLYKYLEKNTPYIFDGIIEKADEVLEPCVEVSCKRCGEVIRLPSLYPNIETNRYEELAYGICSAKIQDIEKGITFCLKCANIIEKQGMWKTEAIEKWIMDNKGKCLVFNTTDFCNEFRNDKKIVAGVTVKYKLDKIGMPLEVIANKEVLRVKID
jgi:hypothetical protein